MSSIELGHQAATLLDSEDLESRYYVHPIYFELYLEKSPELCTRITGTVAYVGCARDFSSLFVFPNATTYVHQDLEDWNLMPALAALQEGGIISDLNQVGREEKKSVYEFNLLGKRRKFVQIQDDVRTYTVDRETRFQLECIYFAGMPYPSAIRGIQEYLLPYLSYGGILHGPYPYSNPSGFFEGAPPEKLGLVEHCRTYKKWEHIPSEEIRKIQLEHRDTNWYDLGAR